MGQGSRALVLSVAGLLLAASCGGGAAAQSPSTTAPVVATLPPSTAATLPPAATPAPTGTAAPTRAATPAAAASSGGTPSATLIAQGKVVFQTVGGVGCQSCHGPDGKGGVTKDGSSAPNITAATEQKLRDALRGGAAAMTNLKLTDAEIEAVMAYLSYLDQQ